MTMATYTKIFVGLMIIVGLFYILLHGYLPCSE